MKNDLIKRFVVKVKDAYPTLTDAEIADTVNSTFNYFRIRMGDDDIPDIRIKGFGSFQVFAAPVVKKINSLKNSIDKDLTHLEYHKHNLEKLENYVEKNHKLFKEYYQRRKKSN
jgi:nucleoid DNA-binding protein